MSKTMPLTSAYAESPVDISLLDIMGVNDFVDLLKSKTEKKANDVWNEIILLSQQLKASRDLLSIGSCLLSNKFDRKILDRLVHACYIVLNAEKVYLFEVDNNSKELVVTNSNDLRAKNIRIVMNKGIEGEVLNTKQSINIPDISKEPYLRPSIDIELKQESYCVICVPIISNSRVIGVLQASNKSYFPTNTSNSSIIQHSLSFSANETTLLNFIGSIASLALGKQSGSQSPLPFNSFESTELSQHHHHMNTQTLSKLQNHYEDPFIKELLDIAYKRLDADRLSVFTYNSINKTLVCRVSQDIEGFSIPSDKGFAGLAFSNAKPINISDIESDTRHNSEVDSKVGYVTKNILSVPMLNLHGKSIGVIQAINKRNGSSFTADDQNELIDVCKNIIKYLASESHHHHVQYPINNHEDNIPKKSVLRSFALNDYLDNHINSLVRCFLNCTQEYLTCESLIELAEVSARLVEKLTSFTYTGIYIVDDHSLKTIDGSLPSSSSTIETYKMSELLPQLNSFIRNHHAEQFVPTEIEEPHYILPEIYLQQSTILPITEKAYPYSPGLVLLVVGSKVGAEVEKCTQATREILDLISQSLSLSIKSLSLRLKQWDYIKSIKRHHNLICNSIKTLRDFVILLNDKGEFISCNRSVDELLGEASTSTIHNDRNNTLSPTNGGTQNPLRPLAPIVEGSQVFDWLTNAHSPELCRDLSISLKLLKSRKLDRVKFFSYVYPDGVIIDYQIEPFLNKEVLCNHSVSDYNFPNYFLPYPSSDSKVLDLTLQSPEDSKNVIVVLIIHIDVFYNQKAIGHHTSSNGNAVGSSILNVSIPTVSAHAVIDAASSILNSIRTSFELSPYVVDSLKEITESMSITSRKISLESGGSDQSKMQKSLSYEIIPLVTDNSVIPSDLLEWNFNVLDITDGMVLCNIIGKLFELMFNLEEISIDAGTLARYIVEVGKNYHDRPFHNLQHSACVTHFTYKLMITTSASTNLTSLQMFGLLLSAVVHDIDHPGNTNLFEVNSGSELALRYNDQAVLENHHCSTAFRLMRKPNMQVLGSLHKLVAIEVRKFIISCILATDMSVHFDLIEQTKKKGIDGWNFKEQNDQIFYGKIILHAADLSNPVRPFEITKEWARRISIEFNDQVSREEALGMPVLGFMVTPDEQAFCKNETGFATFVVAPMWRALNTCFPSLHFLVEQIDNNLISWKELLLKTQQEQDKEQTLTL